MKHSMTGLFISVLAALAVLNGWMYLQQPRMIFYPMQVLMESPADWGLDYEDVTLTAAEGVYLHGWFVPRLNARHTLLFFHGNAGNISHRGDSVAIFHRLGWNVFIVDYRGYGRSTGKPSEAGLYEDARAAWAYLTQDRGIAADSIIVFGRSLGGAVAARLAAEANPGALILESTFSSARDMARAVFPILSRLVVPRYRFDTVAAVRQIRCPVLVAHSPDDEIIPYRVGERVYVAAHDPKAFYRLNGNHNDAFLLSRSGYERALGDFIAGIDTAANPITPSMAR